MFDRTAVHSLGGVHHAQTAVVSTGEGHESSGNNEDVVTGNQHGPRPVVWAEVAQQVDGDEEGTQHNRDPHKPWARLPSKDTQTPQTLKFANTSMNRTALEKCTHLYDGT